MTPASMVCQAEQRPRGAVGYLYSQTAQVASLATSVLGVGIRIVADMPLIGCATLADGARFTTAVGEFLYRRIATSAPEVAYLKGKSA